MRVICDTSPLISLAMIQRLDLLPRLYGTLVVPPAVRDEVVILGAGQAGALEVEHCEWIEVRPPAQPNVARVLRLSLDAGEADAIALALETGADLILLDERKARAMALRLGLPLAGTLDVLIAARRSQLIPAVRPLLDDLMRRAHFRVGRRLYVKLLQSVGEQDRVDS